jgi:hypothetical protein
MPKVKPPKPEHPLPRKEVISIQPGDVIALVCEYNFSVEQAETLKAYMKGVFHGHKIVLLEAGMTLEVYREQVKEYAKDKDTCTDCDKGPCDRTALCPCDSPQWKGKKKS